MLPERVSSKTITSVLERHRLPRRFALLKVDIDSIDYPLAHAILAAGTHTAATQRLQTSPSSAALASPQLTVCKFTVVHRSGEGFSPALIFCEFNPHVPLPIAFAALEAAPGEPIAEYQGKDWSGNSRR